MADKTSLDELLQAEFGFRSSPIINRTTSSIATTATKLMNNNPKRVYATIVNVSANDVYIMLDNTVSSSRGIFLSPNGGSTVLKWREDFHLLSHEWYAIAIGAAADILVIEGVII